MSVDAALKQLALPKDELPVGAEDFDEDLQPVIVKVALDDVRQRIMKTAPRAPNEGLFRAAAKIQVEPLLPIGNKPLSMCGVIHISLPPGVTSGVSVLSLRLTCWIYL